MVLCFSQTLLLIEQFTLENGTSHTVIKEHIPLKDMKWLGCLAPDRNHTIHKIWSIYLNTLKQKEKKRNVSGGLVYKKKNIKMKGWTHWLNDHRFLSQIRQLYDALCLFWCLKVNMNLKTLQNLLFFVPLKKQQQHGE